MPTPDFDGFRRRLREAGFRESNSRYDEAAFGSWLIALDAEPPRRVVWDGKDGRLIVQVQQDDEWSDERTMRDESEQTAEAVIAGLRSLMGHS